MGTTDDRDQVARRLLIDRAHRRIRDWQQGRGPARNRSRWGEVCGAKLRHDLERATDALRAIGEWFATVAVLAAIVGWVVMMVAIFCVLWVVTRR